MYSFSADRQNELSAPQTLHAAVSNGENSKADTQPNIRIDENDPSVNSNSMNTDKKIQRGQGRLSAKDSSGNALTEEQLKYFKDSSLVDKSGRLLKLWHATKGTHTIFDPSKSNYDGKLFFSTSPIEMLDIESAKYTWSEDGTLMFNGEDITDINDGKVDSFTLDGYNVASYYVNAKKTLLDLTDSQRENLTQFIEENYPDIDAEEFVEMVDMYAYEERESEAFTKWLINNGYDSARIRETWGNGSDNYYIINPSPEQIKLTTNLDPSADPDTRFQFANPNNISFAEYVEKYSDTIHGQIVKGKYTMNASESARYNEIMKENSELRNVVASLNHELTRSDHDVDLKDVKKIVIGLVKSYNGDLTLVDDYATQIATVFNYIANTDQIDSDSVFKCITKVAEDIIKNSQSIDTTMQEENADILSELKDTPIQVSDEVKGGMGKEIYNELRKKYMGKLKLRNNEGIPVDSYYQELSSQYPWAFPESVVNPSDQLQAIADFIDSCEPRVFNEYEKYGMLTAATEQLALDIYEKYFDVRNAKLTFADKAENRVKKVEFEYKARIEKAKEQVRKSEQKKQAKIKDHYEDRISKLDEKRREQIFKMEREYKEKADAERMRRRESKARQELLRKAKRLNQMKKKTSGEVRAMIEELIGNLDLKSVYNNFNEAQHREMRFGIEASNIFSEFNNDKKYMQTLSGKHAEMVEITDRFGKTHQISKAGLMSLYFHRQNAQNMAHISGVMELRNGEIVEVVGGGVRIPNAEIYKQGDIKAAWERGYKVKLSVEGIDSAIKQAGNLATRRCITECIMPCLKDRPTNTKR